METQKKPRKETVTITNTEYERLKRHSRALGKLKPIIASAGRITSQIRTDRLP